jgi:hypothetical protein
MTDIDVVNESVNPLNPYEYTIIPNKLLFSPVLSPFRKMVLACCIHVSSLATEEGENLSEEEIIDRVVEQYHYSKEEVTTAIDAANYLMENK